MLQLSAQVHTIQINFQIVGPWHLHIGRRQTLIRVELLHLQPFVQLVHVEEFFT